MADDHGRVHLRALRQAGEAPLALVLDGDSSAKRELELAVQCRVAVEQARYTVAATVTDHALVSIDGAPVLAIATSAGEALVDVGEP